MESVWASFLSILGYGQIAYIYRMSKRETCRSSLLGFRRYVCMHAAFMHAWMDRSIDLSIHPYIHPSIRQSVRPSIHRSIHPSIHLRIYVSMHLCTYVSMYLCIYASMHLKLLSKDCKTIYQWRASRRQHLYWPCEELLQFGEELKNVKNRILRKPHYCDQDRSSTASLLFGGKKNCPADPSDNCNPPDRSTCPTRKLQA